MRRLLAAAVLLGAGTAWATGCTPDFDPQSKIDKPRIIGIRADPPEVQFTEDEQGTVTLTALLALPEVPKEGPAGPRELAALDWTVCVLNLGAQGAYRCAVPESPVDSDPASGTATFDGAVLKAQLEIIRGLMPAFIGFLKQSLDMADECQLAVVQDWDACLAAHAGDEAPCIDPGFEALKGCLIAAGQDITFHLKATWTDGTTPFTQDAYKRVFFRPVTAERPANRNPGFRLDVGEKRDGLPLPVPVASTAGGEPMVVLACPRQKAYFLPVLDEGARERFLDTDGKSKDEFLFFSWYATVGEWERLKSSTAVVNPGDPVKLENRLKMPKAADMPDAFPVWVVVRDDRLGLDWLSFEVRRRPDSQCDKPDPVPADWTQPPVVVVPVGAASPAEGGAP